MNREQAGNMLDAYVLLSTANTKAASDALREVILDAMTETRFSPITISSPNNGPTTIDPFKPYITYTDTCATKVEVRSNAD